MSWLLFLYLIPGILSAGLSELIIQLDKEYSEDDKRTVRNRAFLISVVPGFNIIFLLGILGLFITTWFSNE